MYFSFAGHTQVGTEHLNSQVPQISSNIQHF